MRLERKYKRDLRCTRSLFTKEFFEKPSYTKYCCQLLEYSRDKLVLKTPLSGADWFNSASTSREFYIIEFRRTKNEVNQIECLVETTLFINFKAPKKEPFQRVVNYVTSSLADKKVTSIIDEQVYELKYVWGLDYAYIQKNGSKNGCEDSYSKLGLKLLSQGW